jgi:hypothetical protein
MSGLYAKLAGMQAITAKAALNKREEHSILTMLPFYQS